MDGRYLHADKSSVRPVLVHDDKPGTMEIFSMVCLSDNRYAIYTSENKYWSRELWQQTATTANREKIADWEIFTLIELDSNRVALKAVNGKYLSVDEKTTQLFATGDSIGKQEKFEMVKK